MQKTHAHGAEIPSLGFGTYQMKGDDAREGVFEALEIGYRHIDTAQIYGNEAEVGRAIAASPVDRDDIFLTTKVWPSDFEKAAFRAAVDASLRRLQTDRVDLLLLHWPKFTTSLKETVGLLNRAYAAGKTRHIGVSNFTSDQFQRAVAASDAPILTNQVEYHPFLAQTPVLDVVRDAESTLTAYSPLAKGRVVGNQTLKEIGARYGKSAAQVALRWLLQQEDVMAIPKASSSEHRRANFDAFDFELTGDEMETIHGLARPDGRITSPANVAPEWDRPEHV
jgi:diketogulonate reductase-like aldo/keto reductase